MSVHPIDSKIYGHLWSTAEVRELLSDEGRTEGWLRILAALAGAQAELGLVPADAAQAIEEYARLEHLDLDRVAQVTRETGHSTLGLIRCLHDVLPPHARDWVYYGATVQDVTDTWTSLVIRQTCAMLEGHLDRAEQAAASLAERHAKTVMCGRTHGQPGLPTTFGFKAAVWTSELHRHRERLREGQQRWNVVQLGGALGTMEFWGDSAVPLLEAFAARLGLKAPDIAWLTARDRIAEFVSICGMVTSTLAKIGQEVYQLQRPEIGEVGETPTEGVVGSITMPHKVNPERSEHLVTLARLVRPQVGLALEAMLHEHERDGRAWKTEWVVLPETIALTCTAAALAVELLDGLTIDAQRMSANVTARGGYVMSEPVMRDLSRRLGKPAAHALVHRVAMAGRRAGVEFGEALRNDAAVAEHLSAAEVDRALDPAQAIGKAVEFVERVLGGRSPR